MHGSFVNDWITRTWPTDFSDRIYQAFTVLMGGIRVWSWNLRESFHYLSVRPIVGFFPFGNNFQ